MATYFERDKPWHAEHLEMIVERVRERLAALSMRLGEEDWLDGTFTAADLLMILVLRRLDGSGIVDENRTWLLMSRAA